MLQIGAQLYTVRMYCQNERDLGRTLERVAKIGYRNVQLSGLGNIAPQRVKALCDANGLKIVLTHNPEQKFLENVEALIDEHLLYGCKYVGLGAMSERYRRPEWVDCFAKDMEAPARKLRDAGLTFMYHHHNFEFGHLPAGGTIMDRLLAALPAELMGVTADTYWLQMGGVDANEWLAGHADRLHCVHFKDFLPVDFSVRMAAVGQGNMDFGKMLDTLRQNGVTEYVLVEQDDCYGQSPFDCLQTSYDCLKALGC